MGVRCEALVLTCKAPCSTAKEHRSPFIAPRLLQVLVLAQPHQHSVDALQTQPSSQLLSTPGKPPPSPQPSQPALPKDLTQSTS